METLDHLRTLARRSYQNTSFSPERRGDADIAFYSQELDEDIKNITNLATTEEAKQNLPSEIERYKSKYESLLSAYFSSHSNVASTMITGPSNFPTERNRKRGEWADNKYKEFREWRERALKAIEKSFKEPVDELEMNRAKLEKEEKMHDTMIKANKIIRKGENVIEKLIELGISKDSAEKLLTPEYGQVGFPAYALTNSSARIKQYKNRIAVLEQKQIQATNENKEVPFEGGKVLLNYQLDRVQILYDTKPSFEVITKLKKRGFKWSPSNMAWQRQLTQAGKWAAEDMTGVKFAEGGAINKLSETFTFKELFTK